MFSQQYWYWSCLVCKKKIPKRVEITEVLEFSDLQVLSDIIKRLWPYYDTVIRSIGKEWVLFTAWRPVNSMYGNLWRARDNVGKWYVKDNFYEVIIYLSTNTPIPFYLARQLIIDLRWWELPQRKQRKKINSNAIKKKWPKKTKEYERTIRRMVIDYAKCADLTISEWEVYDEYLNILGNEKLEEEIQRVKNGWWKRVYDQDYPELVSYIKNKNH